MLKKQYLADNKTCKVTFTSDPVVTKNAAKASVVGEFNGWDENADPMKRRKDGTFAAAIKLGCGKHYQFRYLIDGSIWENDAKAARYVRTPFGDCDNSVIEV